MSPVLRRSPRLLPLMLLLLCAFFLTNSAADSKEKPRKKKDIRDYNDADMARLLEQWEVGPSGASLSAPPLAFSYFTSLSRPRTSSVTAFCPSR